jgi:predicted MPP superfamily phosphohydrolase
MKRKVRLFWIAIGLFLFGAIVLAIGFYNTRRYMINEVEIKSTDIPAPFNGTRMVFISDTHFSRYFSQQQLSRIVDQIIELNPDIVFLGGDYVFYDKKYIAPFFKELGRLHPPLGIFGVLGNHDHWADDNETRRKMKENGITCCDNKSFWVKKGGDSIKIGGVDDLWYGTQMPENTLRGLKKSDFAILLSHHPDYLENIHSDLIDLTLSGHTHGGQVTLFGWAPLLPSEYGQKYRHGLIRSGNTQSYITSGIGTVIPPVRFFCPPEIVLLKLRKN